MTISLFHRNEHNVSPKSVWILWFSSLIWSCAWSSIWQSAVTRELVQALLNSLKRFLQHVPPAHSSRRQIILQQRKPLREHVSERGNGANAFRVSVKIRKTPMAIHYSYVSGKNNTVYIFTAYARQCDSLAQFIINHAEIWQVIAQFSYPHIWGLMHVCSTNTSLLIKVRDLFKFKIPHRVNGNY